MSQSVLSNVTLDYPAPSGDPVRALDRVSLLVRSGEFVSLVGPSGCGKSTILKLVSGLLAPTAGWPGGAKVASAPVEVPFPFRASTR